MTGPPKPSPASEMETGMLAASEPRPVEPAADAATIPDPRSMAEAWASMAPAKLRAVTQKGGEFDYSVRCIAIVG